MKNFRKTFIVVFFLLLCNILMSFFTEGSYNSLQNVRGIVGETVVLEIEAPSFSSPASLTIYHEQQVIDTAAKIDPSDIESGYKYAIGVSSNRYFLMIRNVNKNDEGRYEFVFKNLSGEYTEVATLTVYELP